jgi:hypothetical protein
MMAVGGMEKSMAAKRKYTTLQDPWNRRYSRMKAQAKYRQQEWNLTPKDYMQIWDESGVKEHCGREPHQYCMVRKDPIESWSKKNCIIVTRRMHLRKQAYVGFHSYPSTDWEDRHGVNNAKE